MQDLDADSVVYRCANDADVAQWVVESPISGLEFVRRHQALYPGSMLCSVVRATIGQMMLGNDVDALLNEIAQFLSRA